LSTHPQPVPQAPALPSVGELVNGKYRVDGTAGAGGMGVVLIATHVELGHRVAIKVLAHDGGTNDTAVERFLREGKAAASLRSDHVVRIYDVGRLESGIPFMVMELLIGEDLGSYVSAHGPVEPTQAVDWILQACNAIAEAHASGIIHRDLKPANLFLTQRSDGSDCVKVLDFGISKRLTSPDTDPCQANLTATRQIVGSPAYMSPEQVRNTRDVDHRVDIWALGMTLYEFLSGRPAFFADTFPAVCAAIAADAPVPLREVVPDIPQGLERIVLQCLEKDPAKRFASVSDLAATLVPYGPIRAPSVVRTRHPSTSKADVAHEVESSTLISAKLPGDVAASGPRGIVRSESDESNQTLCSNSFEPEATTKKGRGALTLLAGKRSIWLLLGVLGFAAEVGWKLRTGAVTEKPRTENAPVVTATRFTIRFVSEPSSASVWEGDRLLGVTPFDYAIEHESVLSNPRSFVVRAEGYAPFAVNQGDSGQDVVAMARLLPATDPAPSANTSPAAVVQSAPRSARRMTGASPRNTAQPLNTSPNDIRMQR
jgi:eukaryotic-like serine/threonine-protein kinase